VANLSLAKLPWHVHIAAMVAIAIAGGGTFYYFYEVPQQEQITAQSKNLSDIRGRISNGQAMARQLPEFRKEIGRLEARLESLKPILPDERDVGELLRRVQTLATQSNLQVRGFRPQAITTKEMHAEWPIALQLDGSYHNLGAFLDRVSKFPRIINIGGIDVAAKDRPTPQSSMTINATATTFVLVDTPPAAAADPTAKKGAKKAPAKAPAKKQ
jgi:type IV pilus assembly protein PilO